MSPATRSAALVHRPSALRRFLACILVVFTFVGTSGAWHAAGDDPDCAQPAAHDHSAHHERFGSAKTSEAPTHCAICHWLQGFRIDSVPDTRVAFDDAATSPILALTRRPLQLDVRIDVPSRAPPA